jgi:hypothetical protein
MIASLGIKAVGSIVGTHSARSQADREQQANTKQVNDVRTAAIDSTNRSLQDLDARELQDMMAAAQEADQVTRASQKTQSTAIVAAGESGLVGQSVDELLNDVKAQASRNRTTISTNLNITEAQLQRNRDAVVAQGQNQYNSVQPVKINKPSYLASVLGIAGSVVGVTDYAQSRNPQTGNNLSIPASAPPLLSNTTPYDDGM